MVKRPKISVYEQFFNVCIRLRMNKAMVADIDRIVKENPEIFNSRSHFIRAAINTKIAEGWETWVI